MPLNGATANVVRHDLDLQCHGQEYFNENISEIMRASEHVQI